MSSDNGQGKADHGEMVPYQGPRSLTDQFTRQASDVFASWPIATEDDRVDILRAFSKADLRVEDSFNARLEIVKFVCHEVQIKSIASGEKITAYRSVLFTADRKTVSTVSVGVFNGLKRIVGALGCGVWNPPLILEIRSLRTEGGGRFYELLYHGRGSKIEPQKKGHGK